MPTRVLAVAVALAALVLAPVHGQAPAPTDLKGMLFLSLISWAGVLYFGRMMPYIGAPESAGF